MEFVTGEANKVMVKIDSRLRGRGHDHLKRELISFDYQEAKYLYKDGRPYLNFSSNDYLGLSSMPHLSSYPMGSASSRLVCGTFKRYEEVEKMYGRYFGFENSLFFASGYQANIGLMSALFDEKDQVLIDKRIHASLIQGLKLSRAKITGFAHGNWESFEKKRKDKDLKAVILESLYSMDGDLLDREYIEKNSHQFPFLVIDEAHSLGVIGEKGRGLATHLADITVGTLGKAFGFHGAFILCSDKIRDYLINFCSSFQYTTALPPSHYENAAFLLDKVSGMDAERAYLKDLSLYAKECFASYEIEVRGDAHILSIPIGAEEKSLELSGKLLQKGLYVFPARYPTCPFNQSLLRLGLTVHHDQGDIKKLVSSLRSLLA